MRCLSAVKWFDAHKGFGFIAPPPDPPDGVEAEWDREDIFVHYSEIGSNAAFRVLRAGQRVAFDLVETPKGWHARRVELVEAD